MGSAQHPKPSRVLIATTALLWTAGAVLATGSGDEATGLAVPLRRTGRQCPGPQPVDVATIVQHLDGATAERTAYSMYAELGGRLRDADGSPLIALQRQQWAVGTTYHLPPLRVSATNVGDQTTITFKITPTPPGFFLNGDTGEIIGVASNTSSWFGTGPREVTVYAAAPGLSDTELGNVTFEFLYRDSDPRSSASGPGGRPCLNNASTIDADGGGASWFDGVYGCGCQAGWEGANCDTSTAPVAAPTSSTNDYTFFIMAGLIGVGFLVVIALVPYRVQAYRLNYRPVDVTGMQAKMMQSLGLAAGTVVGPGEFGIELQFAKPVADHAGNLPGEFKMDIAMMLRKSHPQVRVVAPHAKVSIILGQQQNEHRLLVTMPNIEPGMAEVAVDGLNKLAHKSKLDVGTNTVIKVGLALPSTVPREISRRALTKLQVLAEGDFREVRQYQFKERGANQAAVVHVAAKSLRGLGGHGGIEAREALLREATLGALLQHRNIVATVGVVTTPRDRPALLLLAFCAEGNLDDHVNEATPTSMSVVERLTYCAQILQGLQYITARNIVHRDVAARNVLLDSALTCKIADFGMASSLPGGDEHARATEMLALRWSAPEVIKKGIYSSGSDIWAFGVLAYEVFGCGVVPYGDQFDNQAEVSAYVKEGGKLERPNPAACPLEVYAQLLLPCFEWDPEDRPSFGELYRVAVKNGAKEDDEALAERALQRQREASPANFKPSQDNGKVVAWEATDQSGEAPETHGGSSAAAKASATSPNFEEAAQLRRDAWKKSESSPPGSQKERSSAGADKEALAAREVIRVSRANSAPKKPATPKGKRPGDSPTSNAVVAPKQQPATSYEQPHDQIAEAMAGNGVIANPLYQMAHTVAPPLPFDEPDAYLNIEVDSPDAETFSETLSEAGSAFGFEDVQKSPRPSMDEAQKSPRPSMDVAKDECGYVSGRGNCRSKKARGRNRCKFHSCPTKGCGKDKDSKAKTCGNCPKVVTDADFASTSLATARAKLKRSAARPAAKPASTIDALLAAESNGVGQGKLKARPAGRAADPLARSAAKPTWAAKPAWATAGKDKLKGLAHSVAKPASTIDALLAAGSDEDSSESEDDFGFSQDDLTEEGL